MNKLAQLRCIVVTGCRVHTHQIGIWRVLDRFKGPNLEVLYHGGAKGADRLAGAWAAARGVPVRVFEPDWTGRGRRAGLERNVAMLSAAVQRYPEDYAVLVLGFPLPTGSGTQHCLRAATEVFTLPTIILRLDPASGYFQADYRVGADHFLDWPDESSP
jgi:hypothetical protein